MKKVQLKITKGLKGIILAFAILGGTYAIAHQHTREAGVKTAFTIGLVAAVKKRNPDLSVDEEKTLQIIQDEMNAELAKEIENLKKGLITEEEFKKAQDKLIAELTVKASAVKVGEGEAAKSIEEILREQGSEITAIKLQSTPSQKVSKSVMAAILNGLAENKDAIAALKSDKRKTVTFTVKAAVDMLTTQRTGDNDIVSEVEPGMTSAARRSPFLRAIINVGNTIKEFVKWVEKYDEQGNAAPTAEGAAYSKRSWKLRTVSKEVKKITAITRISDEMADDIDFIQTEVNNDLREEIELKLDSQILTGDDTGENLKGIDAYATAFNGGGLSGTVINPNNADVLRAAINQIRLAEGNATHILLNPTDVAAMELEKSPNDGHYIMPPFQSVDGTRVKGLPVIENTGITAGEFKVIDASKSNLRIRQDINVTVGLDGTDFSEGMFSIRAEMRGVHYIKNHHTDFFVKGDFETAKALLLKAQV